MKLVDNGSFDRLQQAFVVELLRTVKRQLVGVEAPEEMVEELTGRIGFAVAGLIDDVAGFESNGEEVTPVLTFQTADDELEYFGGSYLHEYVYRLLPAVLIDDE